MEQIEHLRCKHRIRVLQGHEDTTKQNVVSRAHLPGLLGPADCECGPHWPYSTGRAALFSPSPPSTENSHLPAAVESNGSLGSQVVRQGWCLRHPYMGRGYTVLRQMACAL